MHISVARLPCLLVGSTLVRRWCRRGREDKRREKKKKEERGRRGEKTIENLAVVLVLFVTMRQIYGDGDCDDGGDGGGVHFVTCDKSIGLGAAATAAVVYEAVVDRPGGYTVRAQGVLSEPASSLWLFSSWWCSVWGLHHDGGDEERMMRMMVMSMTRTMMMTTTTTKFIMIHDS